MEFREGMSVALGNESATPVPSLANRTIGRHVAEVKAPFGRGGANRTI